MSAFCFICGTAKRTMVARKNGFTLFRCASCGLVTVDPPPTPAQLDHYYKEGYNQYRFSFDAPLAEPKRGKTHYLKVLNRIRPSGRLLDVGCAYGHFLQNAKVNGWVVEGVEPLTEARVLTQSRFRVPVHEKLSQAADASFDAVTCWHVLEHLPAPREFLEDVGSKLVPGGVLAIATPNVESLSARMTGESWGWLSPPDHLVLYSRSTLARLLEQNGYEVLYVETGRGPAKNILLMMLQGIVYRLGLFNTIRPSVQKAAHEYQSGRGIRGKFSLLYLADRITEGLTFLLTPLVFILWNMGLGDEVLAIARKKK